MNPNSITPRRPSMGWRRRLLQGTAAAAVWVTATHAGTFSTDFSTDPGGISVANRSYMELVKDGHLTLIDLADLVDENGAYRPSRLPLQASYILPSIDGDSKVAAFTATFRMRMGGGTERGAQGVGFVLAGDLDNATIFREAGGATKGLVISFDEYDSKAVNDGGAGLTEGNLPGEAPGIIVKQGGKRVLAQRFDGLRTDPPGTASTPRFATVQIQLDADGTLDVTYDGKQVITDAPIGYVPVAGRFGFGAGTEEITIAQRDNFWIDDLTLTTTPVTGAHIASVSPRSQDALPDAPLEIGIQDLGAGAVSLQLDGQTVTPSRSTAGNITTLRVVPTSLFAPGSTHTVRLAYADKTFLHQFSVLNIPVLPPSAALAAGTVDTSKGGFQVRVHKAENAIPEALGASRAEHQLAGLYGPNIANLSTANADGTFDQDVVNFSEDESNAGDVAGDTAIPGITSGDDNIAMEVVGYLDLQPGVYTLGGVSDGSMQVRIGGDPRDLTSLRLIDVPLGRGQGSFLVQQAGLYAVRVLWTEGGGGSALELWSVNPAGGKVLLNDRSTTGHIQSYRARSAAFRASPWLSGAIPAPGSLDMPTRPKIELQVTEDLATVDVSTLKVSIDGTRVTLAADAVTKSGKVTTVRHQPSVPLSPNAGHTLTLQFDDSNGNRVTREISFTTGKAEAAGSLANSVKGYWTFDRGDLAAHVGQDLEFIDASLADRYAFGTTGQGSFSAVPDIHGKPARVLHIPYTETSEGTFKKIGLRLNHGILPNGGGAKVNQWTLVMDVLWGDQGPSGFAGVLQTHDLENPGDADMFWRARDGSYGKTCCSAYDGVAPDKGHARNAWARVAFAVDLAASPRVVAKFINGVKHLDTVTSNGNALDSRFALPPEIFLFGDGDDNERTECWISSLQVRQGRMSDDEIAALGGPSPLGIPTPNPVKGEWNFNGNLKATVGQDLEFIDASLADRYAFGTTGQGSFSAVPDIHGKPARVLHIPYTETSEGTFKKIGLRLNHGILPNGGGAKVNQWTLVMDVLWGDQGPSGFAGVLQTHDLENPGDADMFWRARDGSYGKTCCSAYDGVAPDKGHARNAWARVAFAVDLAASPRVVAKFINGVKHLDTVTSNGNALDSRFALPPEVFLFGDGDDNERTECWVSAIQIREGRMSDEDIAALGGPEATGIPSATVRAAVVTPTIPELLGAASVNGPYATEASAQVDVVNRTIRLPRTGDARFFRVRGSAAIQSVTRDGADLVIVYR